MMKVCFVAVSVMLLGFVAAAPGMASMNTMATQPAAPAPAAMRTKVPAAMGPAAPTAMGPNTARTMGGSNVDSVCATARAQCAAYPAGAAALVSPPHAAHTLAELARLSTAFAALSDPARTACNAYLACIEPEDCATETAFCLANPVCVKALRDAVEAWEESSEGMGMDMMGMAMAMGDAFADAEALKYLTLLITDASFRAEFVALQTSGNAAETNLLACVAPTPTPAPWTVNAAVQLNGVSEATFSSPTALAALRSALATIAGVDAAQVVITSIVDSTGRATVYFEVTLPGGSHTDAHSVSLAIQDTATVMSTINASLAAASVAGTVTSVTVTSIILVDPVGNEETDL